MKPDKHRLVNLIHIIQFKLDKLRTLLFSLQYILTDNHLALKRIPCFGNLQNIANSKQSNLLILLMLMSILAKQPVILNLYHKNQV